MTIYLRDKHNKTVVDVEVWEKREWLSKERVAEYVDVSCSVALGPYSSILLDHGDKFRVIEAFSDISELRGWFHEVYKPTAGDDPSLSDACKAVQYKLESLCKEFGLRLVTD